MVDITWSQPSLPLGPRPALRLRYDALVDPLTEEVVLRVEATTFPERTLIALWTTAPVAFADLDAAAREAGTEFTRLLREHTGPFT